MTIWQKWEGNTPLTIGEIRAHGIQPEKFIHYFSHYHELLPTYDKRISIQCVEKDGDFEVYHYKYEMPLLISNRSFFNTQYLIEGSEPGEY